MMDSGIKISESISKDKFNQWYDIFLGTNSRWLSRPYEVGDVVLVHYTPGDYEEFCKRMKLVNTNIKEKKSSMLVKLRRKIIGRLKSVFM